MRTYSIIRSLALMLTLAGLASSANAQWQQTTDHNPLSVEIGGKFFVRPGSDLDLPLVTDSRTLETLLNVNQATELGNAPAAEIKFNFNSPVGQQWEFRSIIANWEESLDPIVGANLASPFIPAGSGVNRIDYQSEADFYSFELMARRAAGRSGFVWMLGPRVVSSGNSVNFSARAPVDPGQGSPPINVTSSTLTAAKNTMIGLQGGLELNRPLSQGLYLSGFARAGGYFNSTRINTTDSNSFNDVVTSSSISKGSESFLGEAGGRLYMDVVPNVFSIYAGYEANWIDGFAVAPAQLLRFEGPPSVETTNTIFFHGVTFGLKYTY